MPTLHAQLKEVFKTEDLQFLGVVSPKTFSDFERYQTWLGQEKHGGMVYLEKNQECRRDLNLALSGVESVISFALPYYFETSEKEFRIARYAQFQDYHTLMKQKGERVVEKIQELLQETAHAWRVTVDSVPVLERALAGKTGEGFIGKNTCFIHPRFGSFLLLGEILTTYPIPFEEKVEGTSCGTCTLCQVECPTGALSKDYEIDARKCLAYWTIEHRGVIPFEYWPHLKEFVFGCDLCQDVCPFNREAKNQLPASIPRTRYPGLYETAVMDETQYKTYFGGTPMTRAKREGLKRNALIAMVVSHHPRLHEAMENVSKDAAGFLKETLEQIPTYLKLGQNQTMVRNNNVEMRQ